MPASPDGAAGAEVPLPRHPVVPTPASSAAAALVGRRVLVTGARGFIGRHLTGHLLRLDAEVHAVTRPGPEPATLPGGPAVRWHTADLTDAVEVDRLVGSVEPDVVFHLASRVEGSRVVDLVGPMLEANVRAAVNLLAAVRGRDRPRVVLAGSVEEPHRPDEAPVSPYAAAKAAATGYARLFHSQWDVAVTVLRPSMVYGPDQPDRRKLIPYVVTTMLEGRAPQLSSGRRLVDWIEVDDVCEAFLVAATHPDAPGLVADIGSGRGVSIAETVRLAASLIGYDGDLGFGEIEDRRHDAAQVADLSAARTTLGWQPRTSLEEGLARAVRWYRADALAGSLSSTRIDAPGPV
ncbi:NAD-dependent epimerase/dehydratase family protein [Actinomycetospora cinnamomea]|uniref:dTDP-D-glucose 4,6-dehydratase n=1 Tax=Actinomycetospora cinnamomea TaxID=663609 RepID=A0A2U1FRI7_9PSEU|nr:NAD(P)-dependent oxidoreductase [Actinomycetospora cinnamomea]PVZ14776.1 dTDP-D-glucose 4,6-dehydratase [Actinomycetospora cinnamomea]